MSEVYKALYRKWRPLRFDEIVGQAHISKTLKHSIENSRIGHAYLFCGTRGTGKTSAAKIFARAVNCLNPQDGEPCNECELCRQALNSALIDISELDAASNNGVGNIRDILSEVAYAPSASKFKVYIIDEVHMLSNEAFNALLKTLEEPPSHVIFILATTEPNKIPATILSRCQRFDFRRISISEISNRLTEITSAEGIAVTSDGIQLLAELANGSMRDGLSILEQCAAFSSGSLTYDAIVDIVGIADLRILFDISDAVVKGKTAEALMLTDEILSAGKEAQSFLEDMIAHFRNLLICKSSDNPGDLIEKNEETVAHYISQSEEYSAELIIYCISTFSEYLGRLRLLSNPNTAAETAVIKASRPEYSSSNEALLARLKRLERAVSGGSAIPPQAGTGALADEMPKRQEKAYTDNNFSALGGDERNSAADAADTAENGGDEDKPWLLWSEALPIIKNESKKLFAFLYSAKALDRDGSVEIVLKSKVAYDKIATANGIKYLTELFSKVNNAPLEVKVTMEGKTGKSTYSKSDTGAVSSHSILEIAEKKNIFGDRMNIINSEDNNS